LVLLSFITLNENRDWVYSTSASSNTRKLTIKF